MTITLEEIKSAQAKVGEMIATFERQAEFADQFPISVPAPDLLPGEQWICSIIAPGLKYHLTLLPGDNDGLDQEAQLAWALEQGGDLPDLAEQALLKKYALSEFKKVAYWSKEKHATEHGFAWCTDFSDGNQYCHGQSSKFRGRAVRRLVFE